MIRLQISGTMGIERRLPTEKCSSEFWEFIKKMIKELEKGNSMTKVNMAKYYGIVENIVTFNGDAIVP